MDISNVVIIIDWLVRMFNKIFDYILNMFGKDWIETTTVAETTTAAEETTTTPAV